MESNSNFTNFIISSSKNVKVLFIFLFSIFGLTIAFISYFVILYYENKNMQDELFHAVKNSFLIKESTLTDKKNSFENILFSIRDSEMFNNYLKPNQDDRNIKDLFKTTMKINNELMQIRYLDKNGQEVLRINRKNIGQAPYFTSKSKLQNKSDRYYFKEVKELSHGDIWISKMDLNMESGKIVKPIVPTLRISTPIYKSEKFSGTIIINIFIKKLLDNLTSSEFFNVSLLDKEGNFIYHYETEDEQTKDYSWSKYLNKDYNLKKKLPVVSQKVLTSNQVHYKNIYSQNISNVFYNPDELIFLYEIKSDKLEQMKKQQTDYIVIITLIVFFISIPIAFILSIVPVKLSNTLIATQEKLRKKQDILDRYVPFSSTDAQGVITNVSSAFCNLSGYDEDELIGRSHNILSSADTSNEVYEEMWKNITTIGKWKGEVKNINKNGEDFWINLNINSIKNSKDEIIGYQAYSENITSNKLLYRMSVTDGLTSLYNRRFFDEIFPRQIKFASREKEILAFAMIDVDYFKKFNDIYGHQSGDGTLKKIASVLKEELKRPTDYVFRLGGEEFGLLYNVSNDEDAYVIANQIRVNIENLNITHSGSDVSDFITISVGVYLIKPNDVYSVDEIYKNCDEILYKAKQEGRNRVLHS